MNTELIKNSISGIISLMPDEWEALLASVAVKSIKKHDFILKEGIVCDFVAFINSGVLIYYKLLENGNEVTTDFAFAGEWVTDNYSRLCKTPSGLYIKALEDTELFLIRENDLTKLYDRLPKLEKVGRILVEQSFIKLSQLSIELQVLTASQRYTRLMQKYPDVLQKIPLYHIANYLGIAPKSLSRIRKEISAGDS
jgi:CRP-like cAMP-binding protein